MPWSWVKGKSAASNPATCLAAIDSPARTLLNQHGLTNAAGSQTAAELAGVAEPLVPDAVPRPTPAVTDATDAIGIHAAANRLREGLRVLEDYVRFSLDDRHLTEVLKHWRHDFATAFQAIDPAALLALRGDTQGDVGTTVHTSQEAHCGSADRRGPGRVQAGAGGQPHAGRVRKARRCGVCGNARPVAVCSTCWRKPSCGHSPPASGWRTAGCICCLPKNFVRTCRPAAPGRSRGRGRHRPGPREADARPGVAGSRPPRAGMDFAGRGAVHHERPPRPGGAGRGRRRARRPGQQVPAPAMPAGSSGPTG